jgi:hypothetical protein
LFLLLLVLRCFSGLLLTERNMENPEGHDEGIGVRREAEEGLGLAEGPLHPKAVEPNAIIAFDDNGFLVDDNHEEGLGLAEGPLHPEAEEPNAIIEFDDNGFLVDDNHEEPVGGGNEDEAGASFAGRVDGADLIETPYSDMALDNADIRTIAPYFAMALDSVDIPMLLKQARGRQSMVHHGEDDPDDMSFPDDQDDEEDLIRWLAGL